MSTLKKLIELTQTDKYMALSLASEKQCEALIDRGVWHEDDYTYHQEAQEDMRVMMAEARAEFGGVA